MLVGLVRGRGLADRLVLVGRALLLEVPQSRVGFVGSFFAIDRASNPDRLTFARLIRTYVRCRSHAPSPPLPAADGARRATRELRRPAALAPEPGAAQLIGEVSGRRRAARGAAGDAARRGALALPGAGAGAARPRARRARLGAGAAAARGDRRRGRVRARRRGLLRGRRAARALGRHRRGAGERARRRPGCRCGWRRPRCASAPTRRLAARRRARRPPRSSPRARARGFLLAPPGRAAAARLHAGALPSARAPTTCPTSWSGSGSTTLGRLAGLPRDAVADRFGPLGLRALRLARGEDEPLRPRAAPPRRWRSSWSCPRRPPASSSSARWSCWSRGCSPTPSGAGRTVRALRLSARLAAGGGWRRRAGAAQRGRRARAAAAGAAPAAGAAAGPRSGAAPEAVALGPAAGEQLSLWRAPSSSGGGGSPRRCARPARPAAARRCCGCSRWTPPRGCRSAARC